MISDYLTSLTCTTCNISLLRSPKSAVNAIVFCTECRAGGFYADVADDGKALTSDFVTIRELEAMLSEIGQDGD